MAHCAARMKAEALEIESELGASEKGDVVWGVGRRQAGAERRGQWGIAAGKPVSICVNSSAELLSTMESRTAFSLSLVTSNAIVLGYFKVWGVVQGGVGAAAQITQITFKLRRVLLATFGPERERESVPNQ